MTTTTSNDPAYLAGLPPAPVSLTPLQIKAFQDLAHFCHMMNGGADRIALKMGVARSTVYRRMNTRTAANAEWCAKAMKVAYA